MRRRAARVVALGAVAALVVTLGAAPSPSPSPLGRPTGVSSASPAASGSGSPSAPAASASLFPSAPGTATATANARHSGGPPPSPSPASSLTPSPSIASVASRFSGAWRCDGYAAEDSGTQSFMREAIDTIALVGVYDSGKLEADRFSYDATHAVWQLSTVASLTPLVAVPATGDRWIFSGSEGDRRQPHPVRIVYTPLGPAAFRREHQTPLRDGWVDDSEAVCRRTSVSPTPMPTPSPSPSRRPSAIARVARPSQAPSPTPSPPRDRAYRLLGGTWNCETIEGNSAPHDYRLAADGSLLLHTLLSVGTKSYPIDERYRFDRSRNVWTATTLGTAYATTAPPWYDDKWVFDGVELRNGRRVPVRMIYTDLDEHAFRRDFRQLRGEVWQTIASETCTRR